MIFVLIVMRLVSLHVPQPVLGYLAPNCNVGCWNNSLTVLGRLPDPLCDFDCQARHETSGFLGSFGIMLPLTAGRLMLSARRFS